MPELMFFLLLSAVLPRRRNLCRRSFGGFICITCCLCFTSICIAGRMYAQRPTGTTITATGMPTATGTGPWSISGNPAGICSIYQPSLSLQYSAAFNLPEISTQEVLFILPLNRNSIGIQLDRYGFSAFNQITAGVIYGKMFGSELSIGMKFSYHQLGMAGYAGTGSFSVNLGLVYRVQEKISLGAYGVNLSQQQYPAVRAGIPIASRYGFGIAWRSSEQVLLEGMAEQQTEQPADFRACLSYRPALPFTIRGGLALHPLKHYAGFGFSMKSLSADLTACSDQIMGYRSQINLSYVW